MKLFRFDKAGSVGLGMVDKNEKLIDISAYGRDFNETFFEQDGIADLSTWLISNADKCSEINAPVKYLPCLGRPSKIICVGLNYAKHAKESGMDVPKEPVIFFKSTSAMCGPNDPVIIPKGSEKTDWEVELAIIIGKKASYVSEDAAVDYLAGYCLHNDYSERAFQLERSGQWVKGKSCDHFAPLGPYFVTKDEVKDHHNLHLWLDVNGKRMQDSNTSDLIFNIPHIISYISQFMTLLPGDIISTGTPEGVGMGQKPHPIYLKAGDVIELGIEGLGQQRQIAVAYEN
ncbi:MAG: fumarylacetoacetate hydrolase family protein [bacterium]|jgi:2,4-diketo-3-deoxy-L-fuconate hydrolase